MVEPFPELPTPRLGLRLLANADVPARAASMSAFVIGFVALIDCDWL